MRTFANILTATMMSLALVGGGAFESAHASDAPDFARIVKQNRDAVVNISTTQTIKGGDNSGLPQGFLDQLPPNSPFREFFKHFGGQGQGQGQQYERNSLGSGFIISSDGYILTNAHVIADADEIVVKLADNREFEAKVVGYDKPSDVGLLKIPADHLPTLKIGDSSKLEVGQWVLAIGSPFGLEHTATAGIVSALNRNLPNETYASFIQTDVAVNPGNSGGPLFDTDGRVVGINSQIYSRTGGYMGLSFAVPINSAMEVVKQLKKGGKVERGYLGVTIQSVDRDLAKSFGLDKPVGALVSEVMPDSPAKQAGVQAGDVILEFNGHKISDAGDLPPVVGHTEVGKAVDMQVVRDGARKTISVKVGALSEHKDTSGSKDQPNEADHTTLNVAVRELNKQERDDLGIGDRGLLVQKVGPGPVAEAGIRPGDILLRIGKTTLSTVEQLKDAVKDLPAGQPVAVQIRRGDSTLFVSLTLSEKD